MSGDGAKAKNKENIEVLPKEEHPPEKPNTANPSLPAALPAIKQHIPLPPLHAYTKISFLVTSMSIRYKIAGALILVLILAIASLGMVTFSHQKQMLQEEIKKRAGVFVHQLAGVGKEGLMAKDDLSVFSAIKEIQKHSGIVYAMVVDTSGAVFVHSTLTEKGKVLSSPLDKNTLKAQQLLFQQTTYNNEPIMDAALPIIVFIKPKICISALPGSDFPKKNCKTPSPDRS